MKELFNPKIHLKNSLAQRLFEQHEIVIDGIRIKLWRGHTYDNVKVNQTWNRIKSFAEINESAIGDNGFVVFTGIMQIPRAEAAEYAIKLGFKIRATVSRKTDFVVIGSENVSPSKVARVIELNKDGADIHFVDEISFLQLVEDNIDLIETIKGPLNKSVTEEPESVDSELISEDVVSIGPNLLEGKSFVVSGKFTIARDDLKKMISKFGGKNVSAISSKTDYVLAGDAMGPAKLKKAEKLGIPIISEEDFMKMVNK